MSLRPHAEIVSHARSVDETATAPPPEPPLPIWTDAWPPSTYTVALTRLTSVCLNCGARTWTSPPWSPPIATRLARVPSGARVSHDVMLARKSLAYVVQWSDADAPTPAPVQP